MIRISTLILTLFFITAHTPAFAAGVSHLKLYTTHGEFDSVKEDVEIAITGRGLVVDHTSHIGAMLERTGKDIGATKKIYARAESLQFCSADISRKTMEADPSNIVFCPYTVVIYTLPQDPKTVHVGYRRPLSMGSGASAASLKAVEELLDGIVREALNLK